MHEESLVRALLKQVQSLAELHGAVEVEEIELEAGPLSNVEPTLLNAAFERLAVDRLFQNAILVIRNVELVVACQVCRAELVLRGFRFVCSACGASDLRILRGDSLRLLNVKLMVDDVSSDST